jgi:hypothetical protein
MYNANRPKLSELPSPARLLSSTLIAAVGAAVVLVAVVLPSEYGIDPSGAGRVLGLAQMGEIKTELAAEAASDRATATAATAVPSAPAPNLSALYQRIDTLELAVRDLTRTLQQSQAAQAVSTAPAAEAASQPESFAAVSVAEEQPVVAAQTAAEEPQRPQPKQDQASFTLSPGQGIEVKLVMKKGAQANFAWSTEGGPVNFDTHGDGEGDLKISYEKGRGVQSDEGTLTAEFDGNHGWFWRNRGKEPVTLRLSTAGYYAAIKGIPN